MTEDAPTTPGCGGSIERRCEMQIPSPAAKDGLGAGVTMAADDGSGAGVAVAAEDGSGAGVTDAVEGGLGVAVTVAEEDGWGAGVTGAEEDGSGAGVADAEEDGLSAGVTEAEEEQVEEAAEASEGAGRGRRRAVLLGLTGVGVSGRRRLVTSPSGAAFRCRFVAPGFGLVGAAGTGDAGGVAAALVERLIGSRPRACGEWELGGFGWAAGDLEEKAGGGED